MPGKIGGVPPYWVNPITENSMFRFKWSNICCQFILSRSFDSLVILTPRYTKWLFDDDDDVVVVVVFRGGF